MDKSRPYLRCFIQKMMTFYFCGKMSILQIAKLFGTKIKYLPERSGERYASKLTKMNLSNNVVNIKGNIDIEDYITKFKKNNLIKK